MRAGRRRATKTRAVIAREKDVRTRAARTRLDADRQVAFRQCCPECFSRFLHNICGTSGFRSLEAGRLLTVTRTKCYSRVNARFCALQPREIHHPFPSLPLLLPHVSQGEDSALALGQVRPHTSRVPHPETPFPTTSSLSEIAKGRRKEVSQSGCLCTLSNTIICFSLITSS